MTLQNVVKSYRIIYCLYSTWSNNNMLLNWCFSFLKLLFRPFQKSNKMKKLYRKKVWLPLNSKIKFKAKLQIDHIEIWSFRKAVGKQSGSSARPENWWYYIYLWGLYYLKPAISLAVINEKYDILSSCFHNLHT